MRTKAFGLDSSIFLGTGSGAYHAGLTSVQRRGGAFGPYGLRALLIALLLAATALPGTAEVVVFSSGLGLRVESFEVEGEMAAVRLVQGGEVRFPLTVVDRVVASEFELIPFATRMGPLSSAEKVADTEPGRPEAEPILETVSAEEFDPTVPDSAWSISGMVLSDQGDPVAGVEVRARAIRSFQATGGIDANAPEVKSRSDRNGLYRFERLAEGEYGIRTLATDRYTSAKTTVRTGADHANLVLHEKRDVTVNGTVTDNEGKPLAYVSVTQVDRSAEVATTDVEGHYRLELPGSGDPQNCTLEFELEGYGRRALRLSDSQTLPQNEIRLDARLEPLESLVVVEGRVSNSAGAPIPGETVFLVGEQHYEATTDGDGRFLIPEVDSHTTYQLWISPSGPYQKVQQQVRVGAKGLTVNLELEPERSKYASLSGRMVDVGGNPVPHFSLWLRSSSGSSRTPLLVTGDDKGAFSVAEVAQGRLSFTTTSDPRMTVNGPELSSEGAENMKLILDLGDHEIRGRVLDSYGNPVAASLLTLAWSHHSGGLQSLSVRKGTADDRGFFLFKQVGPGLHSLSVEASGFQNAKLQAESPGNLEVQMQSNNQEGGLQGQ